MKLSLRDLWRLDGTIARGPYFLLGAILMAVKFNVDRALYASLFGRTWSPFDFEFALNFLFRWNLYPQEPKQIAILVAAALPFIWSGVALTLRRLRSADLPVWLAVLFFVPLVKFIFFAVLCALPARPSIPSRAESNAPRWWRGFLPHGAFGSAVAATVATFVPAFFVAWLGTTHLQSYSASLFVGLPFCQGFVAALLHGYHQPRSLGACIGVANLSVLCAGLGFLAFALEGVICLVMAAPLGAILATVGACFGYAVQRRHAPLDLPRVSCVALLIIPFLMTAERLHPPEPPLLGVTTEVEVNAPPERVWQNVVAFSELPAPHEWIFKFGIAYPIRARIAGSGVGAIRRCEFSTGPFIEPIEIWDEPRLLKFSVLSNPPPMQEWTPYRSVEPPHLHGFLCSRGGQFHLIPLPDGRTRLEGTTWYHHHMWPARYWQVWSDYLIHTIHRRVLRHVATLSEQGGDA